MTLRVLIVAPQDALRSGLCSIMASDPRVSEVYEARDEGDLRAYLSDNEFDLIVVNQEMVVDLSILRMKNFVILATELSVAKLKIAYMYGACGYLSVNASAELLCTMLCLRKHTFLVEPTFVPTVVETIFERYVGRTTGEIKCLAPSRRRRRRHASRRLVLYRYW